MSPVRWIAVLAAWFHDAVYVGASGSDERDSAQLAAIKLRGLDLAPALVQHVGELIVATTPRGWLSASDRLASVPYFAVRRARVLASPVPPPPDVVKP